MAYPLAGIGIAIVIIAVVLITLPEDEPEPIVSWDGHENYEGNKRLYVIDVTVGNNGEPGYIRVYAKVGSLEKFELIYLNKGEMRTLHFVFDISSFDPAPFISSAGAESA